MFRNACVFGCGVWLLLCAAYTENRLTAADNAYFEELRLRTATQALDVSQRLDGQFRGMQDVVEAFATQPEAVALLRSHAAGAAALAAMPVAARRARLAADPEVAALSDYYGQIIDNTNYDSVSVLDLKGTCIANSNWRDSKSILGGGYGDRRYFRDTMTTGRAWEFAVGRTVRVASFFFARAIQSRGGVLGVSVVRKTADNLVDTLVSTGNLTLVVDDAGKVVASSRIDLVLRRVALWAHEPTGASRPDVGSVATRALDIRPLPHAGRFNLVSWEGRRYLLASHPLPDLALTVWIATPLGDRSEAHRAYIEAGVLAGVAGLLAIFIVNSVIDRSLLRRAYSAQLAESNAALTAANARLTAMARTDPLTGAANRRHFVARVEEGLARARRSTAPCSLLVLDLDLFKRINDTHGHPVGDAVLARVAKTCLGLARATDTFGRVGGEEFALFLWDTNAAGGRLLAERLRAAVEALEMSQGETPIRVTVSIGVTEFRLEEDFESAYARADAALYTAKAGGRNQVVMS